MMNTIVFVSKVDAWLGAVLTFAAIITLGAAVSLLLIEPARPIVAANLALLGAALPLWVMLSTRYTLTVSELRIASGPFRWRIPLRQIWSVTPTRSLLSSPALSLDRLRIDYGHDNWIMLSPRDKERFLKELEVRRSSVLKVGGIKK